MGGNVRSQELGLVMVMRKWNPFSGFFDIRCPVLCLRTLCRMKMLVWKIEISGNFFMINVKIYAKIDLRRIAYKIQRNT